MFGFGQYFIEAIRYQDYRFFLEGIVLLVAALFSIMLHEIAHGVAAWKCGDPTAKYYGRLTLNPVKHFDLWGFLCFFFIGIGWAKPVPVNSSNFRNYRKGMFWVSIAGVLANFILAFVAVPLAMLCSLWFQAGGGFAAELFFDLFQGMFSINLVLIVFNLMPIYPLDGFRVLEAVLKRGRKFKAFMYEFGQYVLFALLIVIYFVSVFFNFSIIGWLANWLAWPLLQFWGLFF